MSGSTFMTGGVLLPTNGFLFANASDLGHLLSFPMQTHEAAFMQCVPDGSNFWDGAGLTTASPHNGQAFAAFSLPDPRYSLVMLPCRHLACNKTFKRGGGGSGLAASKAFISRVEDITCVISGCRKSYGIGYSRPDKVMGYLWRKHANLDFTKA